MKFEGVVCAGRGKGANAINENSDRIAEVLGATPYPGILNVILNRPLTLKGGVPLDAKAKHFGVCSEINGTPCLIERWKGGPLHVLEIVSSAFLRDTLGLKDGQIVELSVPKGSLVEPSGWRSWLWSLFYKNRPEGYYDEKILNLIGSRSQIVNRPLPADDPTQRCPDIPGSSDAPTLYFELGFVLCASSRLSLQHDPRTGLSYLLCGPHLLGWVKLRWTVV